MYITIFIICFIILAYFVLVGNFFTRQVMYIKTQSLDAIYDRELAEHRFDEDFYLNIGQKTFSVPSRYGYNLNGILYEPYQTNKWIIICHGVTVNKNNSIKYVELFIKLGFNVLSYDHRRHGESGGETTSYGYYEKYDLQTIFQFLKELKGNQTIIGIHGESMGASTMLQFAGFIEDAADFYVSDCAFATFHQQLSYRLKTDYKIPKWAILPIGNIWLRFRDQYVINDISPIDAVRSIQKPILFIHSKPDLYIPYTDTVTLFKAKKKGIKKLFLAERGGHAMSLNLNKQQYYEAVKQFLKQIKISTRI